MLLAILDPDLLLYDRDDWLTGQQHVARRMRILVMHQGFILRHGFSIAMSPEMQYLLYDRFPYDPTSKSIPELRDFRQFVFERLPKLMHHVAKTKDSAQITIRPVDSICRRANDSEVVNAFKELVCSGVEAELDASWDPQVATWIPEEDSNFVHALTVNVQGTAEQEIYHVPLVWDEASWARCLESQDFWPDLEKCVEIYFETNPGMRNYAQAREQPIPFAFTENFWRSVERYCDPSMRRVLIKAMTKKVYGILDAHLHDEPLGDLRRFRVTLYWRVHYRQSSDSIVFEEFGPHDIGL